ncbi:hypothetical protein GCM10009743_57020 [Kribbella swartbergensis]
MYNSLCASEINARLTTRSGEATDPDRGPSHNAQQEKRHRQATGPPTAVGGFWERITRNNGLEAGRTCNNEEGENALQVKD